MIFLEISIGWTPRCCFPGVANHVCVHMFGNTQIRIMLTRHFHQIFNFAPDFPRINHFKESEDL